MTLTSVHAAIVDRFKTLLELGGDGGAAIPTRYPNDSREEPATGLWALVTVRDGARDQLTIAPGIRSRTEGSRLYVDLYDEKGIGTKTLTDAAQRVLAAFQRVPLTSGTTEIVFETPGYGAGGSAGQREGKWWRVQVTCPFHVDDED